MNEENKSISLIIEKAKSEYLEAINMITQKHNISPYLLWMIFNDFMREIEFNKNKELQEEFKKEQENKKNEDTMS